MKTRPVLHVLVLLCLSLLQFSPASSHSSYTLPARAALPEKDPASPQDTGEVVLVARDLVDLKWNPAGYPSSPGRFKRWELHRGLSQDALAKIAGNTDQTTDFYRDRNLSTSATYYYRLYVVRCTDPCQTEEDEVYLTYFTDSVQMGVFAGNLHRTLELGEGAYEIGFNTLISSAAVYIRDSATLVVNSKTTLTKKPDISHGGVLAYSGNLSINGATLSSIALTVGEYGSSESNCSATLQDVNFVTSSVAVNAACRLSIIGRGGTFSASASDAGNLTVQNALLDGWVNIEKNAIGTLSNNQITGSITVSGYYASADPKAQVFLHSNLITTPYKHNQGVILDGGASGYLTENTLSFTGVVDDESAILIQAADAGTKLVAQSNRIEHGKILLHWNPTVDIKDNILTGVGSAITVGCPFCGTGPQATGPVERNTLQSGWGFEMWDGSQSLALRHNCIRGNNPGLTVVDTLPTNLDAKQNYWGAASGPRHPANPGGTGDEIVGTKVDYSNWDTTPDYCREAPPPAIPDLTPIGMEVVQSVQTMENSVPLVAGKPTWVRVYAQSSRGSVANVGCVLRGFNGTTPIGTLTAITPTLTVQPPTALIMLRQNLRGGWNFNLPASWIAAGDLRLVAEVNPGATVTELNTTNNTIERTVTFTARRTLRVAFVPIRYHTLLTDSQPNQSQFLPMLWLIRRLYPLSGVKGEIIPSIMEWTIPLVPKALQNLSDSTIKDRLTTRYNLFNANRPPERQIDQILGVFPNNAGLTFCSSDPRWFNGGKGRAAYCVVEPLILAHEIGHNLGLRHPNTPDACNAQDDDTDWPYKTAAILEPGVDIQANQIKLPNYHDLMSYCSNPPRWISPFHATKIFQSNGFPQPAVQAPADATYLFVRGQVDITGTVTLFPSWQLNMISPPINPPEGSAYCVELQDSGGLGLTSACFDPQFDIYEAGESADATTFEIALPLHPGAARVVVLRNGSPVAQLSASAHAPTVELLSPNGGETLSGSFTVTWQASDADLDDLVYHLLFSTDDGQTWLPVAEYLAGTSFTLDTASLPGSSAGRFRVMAFDGFHTSQDDSDASFTTPDNSPLVGIGAPEDGAESLPPFSFSGAAYDYEDGELADDRLNWTSDLDGPLGTGANLLVGSLAVGEHQITLAAVDSQGHSAQHTIVFTVLEPPHIYLPVLHR